tara:strand:+ start:4477 stop:4806 length:330 start_codon:yes stop_codon:yes gene_type:complete
MSIQTLGSLEECERLCTQVPDRLIVLDFSAAWCAPCKRIYPVLEQLAVQYPQVGFFKVDIDDAEDIAEHFCISTVPSFKFIYNNKIVAEFSGGNSEQLVNTLADLVKNC